MWSISGKLHTKILNGQDNKQKWQNLVYISTFNSTISLLAIRLINKNSLTIQPYYII